MYIYIHQMATQFMRLCDQVTVTLTRLWYHDLPVPKTGDSFDWAELRLNWNGLMEMNAITSKIEKLKIYPIVLL